MKKFYSSKPLLKLAGGGMHPQHPPLDPPLTLQYRIYCGSKKQALPQNSV